MRGAPALLVVAALAGCGGGGTSSEDGARATVQRYLAALGRGDAAAACRQFTESSREKLAEFGSQKLRLHSRSCEATIDAALHAGNGPQLRKLGQAKITRVKVEGDSAEVSVEGVGGRTKVVKGDSGWLIDSQPGGETD